jgi:hypothetical protein
MQWIYSPLEPAGRLPIAVGASGVDDTRRPSMAKSKDKKKDKSDKKDKKDKSDKKSKKK